MYFHVGYGGDRRRYGGAGRNSQENSLVILGEQNVCANNKNITMTT